MSEFLASRRSAIRTASVALAAAVAGCATSQTASQAAAQSSTFVLVHGSWHGGWCYSRVAALLRQQGHFVYTPTNTGLGERSNLLSASIGLQTHVEDVVNVVKWEDLNNIVLVGHSYGGMVVTGVAEQLPGKIKAIVFLDAFIPGPGQSLYDLSAPASAARMDQLVAQNGGVYIKPFPAKAFNVNDADQAWVDSKCTPQPYKTFKDSLPSTSGVDKIRTKVYVRSAYVNGTFEGTANKLQGTAGWRVVRMQSGHDLMVDRPKELTEVLIQATA
jgi:pimeloyl-ACP methyl ester carboxylesterase